MDIVDPTDKTVDALMKLDLPAGVDVESSCSNRYCFADIIRADFEGRLHPANFCFTRTGQSQPAMRRITMSLRPCWAQG